MEAASCLRIGDNHGYRIAGDTASLNADLAIGSDEVYRRLWALQLWACDHPYAGGPLGGTKVAELLLALPSPPAPQVLQFAADAFAHIPADRREYSMVLVLASLERGVLAGVHDFVNFPQREVFVVPYLDGGVGYSMQDGSVRMNVDRIVNPRPPGSVSGSLALELRALPESCSEGEPEGVALARSDIGQIQGQSALEALELRAELSPPPPGRWRLTMLLKEWTVEGFQIRDYTRFAVPFECATPPPPSHDEIAMAAYHRYLARGKGPGDAVRDWLEAERELTLARRGAMASAG